ncbi:MAG: YeeE/YedE family protein [Acidobacteria bacterium]|nr:YeeE/YedE family protein [Acidobacteriota bacterium]
MIKVIILGIVFGVILQRSRVNTFDRIGGFAMLKDFTVPKVMLTAIAVSIILLFIEVKLGMAGFHVKALAIGGIVGGGVLFGMGMAILGYCPGTLIVSTGEGALDALIGLIIGIVTGAFFVVVFPHILPFLGPNLGKIQLLPVSTPWKTVTVVVVAISLFWLARKLDTLD